MAGVPTRVFAGVGLGAFVFGMIAGGCASFGTTPSDERKVLFRDSRNYSSQEERFVNAAQERIDKASEAVFSWDLFKKMLFGPHKTPEDALPQNWPDFELFQRDPTRLKAIWFGHSTFLLHMNGKVILVDPIFARASPVFFFGQRFQDPVVKRENLPKVDHIVISHDHYDHLEMDTAEYFADKDVTFLVPLGVGSHLEGWGVRPEKIIEKDWWESVAFDGVEFVATPSQHFSGRSLSDGNQTLWASWVIRSAEHSVYFSGDTGYSKDFKEIGRRYGPFDIAFMENGQYNKLWPDIHLLPEDGVRAFRDLNAKKYLPVHWGMYSLAPHTWFEPIVRISELAQKNGIELVTPLIGEVLDLSQPNSSKDWWSPLLPSEAGEESD